MPAKLIKTVDYVGLPFTEAISMYTSAVASPRLRSSTQLTTEGDRTSQKSLGSISLKFNGCNPQVGSPTNEPPIQVVL
ncbi:hypothetical protein QUB80_15220 [Chlorogloeopsis sp. ULAP01]|uniref:hypothetical protein n=1 Tax=Chlorogloeopsis sp. ULAP01 TaxID=3056483 RepID=UPI0025AA4896|nr:hypothetical protein [Chlorogloeopsis sp. ULAP01]MDM9382052.1 hypothetical protein [Chlorogloeopsis sp. ULAP01]